MIYTLQAGIQRFILWFLQVMRGMKEPLGSLLFKAPFERKIFEAF